MWQQAKWFCILSTLAITAPTAWGQTAAWRSKKDVLELARKIDQHIAAAQKGAGVVPAPPAEHGAFFRRLHLDLAGIIPTLANVQDYIENDRADKLWTQTEEMLRHKPQRMNDRTNQPVIEWTFARHFAAILRAHILKAANQQAQPFLPSFELWLKEQLEKDVGYDKIVHTLLSPGSESIGNNMMFRPGMGQTATASPAAFYIAAESKAENLAGSASRVFLGVKLECAQCHKHPFAKWTRDEFWQFAAFFAGTQPAFNRFNVDGAPARIPASTTREITIPGTAKVVKAKFLTGDEPKWKPNEATRAVLADWVSSPKNPYFAKATADMVWQYFFGVSLLEPILEPNDDSPITHPQLLDDLANGLIEHDFDLKYLVRAIVHTQAYQRTSRNHGKVTPDDYVLFTRMPVRGMSPEQLFDSVVEAVIGPDGHDRFSGGQAMMGFNPRQPNSPRALFLAKFSSDDKSHESQTSILQALFMMNGKFLAEEIRANKNLDAIASAPAGGSVENRVATLYRMVLTRDPRPEELSRLVAYMGSDTANLRQRLGDVLWALVNSAEFRLNH